MMKLRITALTLCLSLVLGMALPCALAEDDGAPKLKSAQCALLGDMGSGRILFNIDAYSRREPASLTKIMTLLLAVEAIEAGTASPDDMVTASAACKTGLEHDSSTAYIDRGETMSLRDLLYCAALASANEACNIIAEHISGSISAFVERMNTRAAELGCSGTHFANTHGMPDDNHYTTARDIFLIACEGMRHQLFAQLVGCREYTTSATNDSPARVLESSNALITPDSPYSDKYVYPGAVGIKTGYTEKAGYCLVSAVQRDGVNVIAVVLGADGDAAAKEFDSFADTVTLLDWCFENYSYRSIVERGYPAAAQPIEKDGRRGELTLVCAQEINALAEKALDGVCYGVEMQGATSIALTKLDVLSYMDKIPLCAHYEIDGVQTDDFPFPILLDRAKPVMEYMPGWQCDISGARRWEDLPEAARSYVEYVEKAIGCPIGYVSVGAERESLILR